jgi:DNA-directed RNA polymerase subunit RPC12/RpoP
MAQKELGYVELEWTCKRCGTKNPGTQKTCTNCGAAMGAEEKFDLPAQQTLMTEQEAQVKMSAGPDVHCPYCGTRNPAGTLVCLQCGGDLKGARQREQGQVLGAYESKPAEEVKCPACGLTNPANAPRCQHCGASLLPTPQPAAPAQPVPARAGNRLFLGACLGIALLAVIGVIILFAALGARKTQTSAVVQSVDWQRSIQVLEQRPAGYSDWEDQIPAGAQVGQCEQKYRYTQAEPAPGAEEVCGTPYTVDQGSGVGKVVQDCEYRVFDSYCDYTVVEWTVVDTALAQGSDLNPDWPTLSLGSNQREGDRSESYRVTFRSGSDTYHLTVSAGEFSRFIPGSQWLVTINALGSIVDIQPK